MPAKGWKKEEKKDYKLQVRLTEKQKLLLNLAANSTGYKNLSAWLRDVGIATAKKILTKIK